MHKISASWSSESPEASYVLSSFAIVHGGGFQWALAASLSSEPGAFPPYAGKSSRKKVVGKAAATGAEQRAAYCRNACRRYITFVCYQLSQAVKASNLWVCSSHLSR